MIKVVAKYLRNLYLEAQYNPKITPNRFEKMKISCWIIAMGALVIIAPNAFCQTSTDDAKEIFLAEKCQRCHSISDMNIASTGKEEISDLSAVGSKYSEEWLIKYLKREEAVNGKKHMKNLKTSGVDIEKLARWLETLKEN